MTTRTVAHAQAAWYLTTGLWPIVSLRTFEAVTGPKTDDWLVRTVGLLAAVIGLVLGVRARQPSAQPDPLLGTASAAAFAAVDLVYAGRGRISPIYLGDAAIELAIIAAWLAASRGRGLA